MRKITIKEHIRYWFDNLMYSGTAVRIAWLFLSTLTLIITFAIVIDFLKIWIDPTAEVVPVSETTPIANVNASLIHDACQPSNLANQPITIGQEDTTNRSTLDDLEVENCDDDYFPG